MLPLLPLTCCCRSCCCCCHHCHCSCCCCCCRTCCNHHCCFHLLLHFTCSLIPAPASAHPASALAPCLRLFACPAIHLYPLGFAHTTALCACAHPCSLMLVPATCLFALIWTPLFVPVFVCPAVCVYLLGCAGSYLFVCLFILVRAHSSSFVCIKYTVSTTSYLRNSPLNYVLSA